MDHLERLEDRQLRAGVPIDASYGSAGTAVVRFPHGAGHVFVRQIATDSAGNAYVVAARGVGSGGDLQIRRLKPDGTVDSGWAVGKGGDLTFAGVSGATVRVDPQNRLDVLIGSKIYRYSADGTADASFGTAGVATLTNNTQDFTIDPNGRIWAVGFEDVTSGKNSVRDMAVQRLISRGRFDRTFGDRGTFLEAAAAVGQKILALPDGTVVAAGFTGAAGHGGLGVKFNADGSLVRTYGTHGVSRVFVGANSDDVSTRVSVSDIRPSGRIDLLTLYSDSITTAQPDAAYISATGKTAIVDDDTPPDFGQVIQDNVPVSRVLPLPDGTSVAIDSSFGINGGLYLLKPDGTYDTAFNGGQAIAGVTDIALTPDGSVLALSLGSDDVVRVRRYAFSAGPKILAYPVHDATAPKNAVTITAVFEGRTTLLDTATVTRDALTITTPSGTTYHPKLVGTLTYAGSDIQATFKAATPTGQPFTAQDDGIYTIAVTADSVKDENGTAAIARTIGSFVVNIHG